MNRGYSKKQDVYEILKEKILYLEWKPGESIREEQLAATLSVSRTPIREALLRLADEHFVDIYAGRGTFVSKIDLKRLREYAYMRHVVERDVLLKLAQEKTAVTAACEETLLLQKLAQKRGDIKGYVRQDHAFHAKLFDLAGHRILWESIEVFYSHTIRYHLLDFEQSGYVETSIGEHEKILACMEEGKKEELAEVMALHHDPHFLEADVLMARYPDYFRLEERILES